MTRFAIQVTLRLHAGAAAAFTPHILENRRSALRDEPDCHGFQVFQTEADPDTFVLVEVYTDEAALERHRETPHYRRFLEAAGELIAEREVRKLRSLTS